MTVGVHDLTDEQRSALQPAGNRRNVVITGPPASGRTTALLHAAMHAMATHLIEARQVILLVPERQAWSQGRRILKAHRSLLGVQVMTASRLAAIIDQEWEPDSEKTKWSNRRRKDREAAELRAADTERALQGVGSEDFEKRRRAHYEKAGETNLLAGLPRFTNVERVLRSAARFVDPGRGQAMRQALPDLCSLILVDDLELFAPADLLFITALSQTFNWERRSQLILTSSTGARYQAWASRLSGGFTYRVSLTDHMNRRQVLSLIEAVDTRVRGNEDGRWPARTRIPARGMSEQFNCAFRRCTPGQDAEITKVGFHEAPFTAGVLGTLRGHITAALHHAHENGQDTAVVLATSIRETVEHQLRTLWAVEKIPETNDAPPELLAALRYVNGLSRPSGGHPLYDGSLAASWQEYRERRAADEAWALGTPLPATAIHARLEGFLSTSSSTAQVIRHLQVDLPSVDSLPDDPLRALERLLARQDEPRRYILPGMRFTHSWPQTIYVCSEYINRNELFNVLSHTLDRVVILIVPEYGRRLVDPSDATTITLQRLVQLAQLYNWPIGKLNGTEPLTRQELIELLRDPAIGQYLRWHAPRNTDEATMARWMTLLDPRRAKRTQGTAGPSPIPTGITERGMAGTARAALLRAYTASRIPSEWLAIKEPARPWHTGVKLLEEQRTIDENQ